MNVQDGWFIPILLLLIVTCFATVLVAACCVTPPPADQSFSPLGQKPLSAITYREWLIGQYAARSSFTPEYAIAQADETLLLLQTGPEKAP